MAFAHKKNQRNFKTQAQEGPSQTSTKDYIERRRMGLAKIREGATQEDTDQCS